MLAYSIASARDGSLFSIDGTSGELSFIRPAEYDDAATADDPDWHWMADLLDNKVELGRLHAVTYGIDDALAMIGLSADNYIA